jgi:NAD+ diphosphatase
MGLPMTTSFLARLPLARTSVDRDYLSRNDDIVSAMLADDATRFIVLAGGLALMGGEGLAMVSRSELEAEMSGEPDSMIYLGRSNVPIFAAVFAASDKSDGEWADLRKIGATLDERDAGLLAEALGMANWHAVTKFSPRSGAPATSTQGGWVLVDSETGADLFPRTDMAIIVAVTDADDRLLLGSNAQWESNRYSLLAGFVEPGESLEAAVEREVYEESGIRVTDPVYRGSQPWPFPASLMIGFTARIDDTIESELTPDGAEILDLRWMSRDELFAARDEIALPGTTSIARALIEEWYGGPLGNPPARKPGNELS